MRFSQWFKVLDLSMAADVGRARALASLPGGQVASGSFGKPVREWEVEVRADPELNNPNISTFVLLDLAGECGMEYTNVHEEQEEQKSRRSRRSRRLEAR